MWPVPVIVQHPALLIAPIARATYVAASIDAPDDVLRTA